MQKPPEGPKVVTGVILARYSDGGKTAWMGYPRKQADQPFGFNRFCIAPAENHSTYAKGGAILSRWSARRKKGANIYRWR